MGPNGAARRNTSVSRLVGQMLAEKMRHDDAYERAMQEWRNRQRVYRSDGQAYPQRNPIAATADLGKLP